MKWLSSLFMWNKRKVEIRKFDCNSFRITGNTNFKKIMALERN